MQTRSHLASLGKRPVDSVTPDHVDRLARAMLERGLAPKTVRNVMTFLHAVFALGVQNGCRAATLSCALLVLDAGVTEMRIPICNS